MAISLSLLSAMNLQNASKDELICIKGIGEKKAASIMEYRKEHKLKSAQDLLEINGIGLGLVKNIENNIKSVACGGKKTTKKTTTKKTTAKKLTKKSESKEEESKKNESKKSETKKSEVKKDESKKDDSKKETTDK